MCVLCVRSWIILKKYHRFVCSSSELDGHLHFSNVHVSTLICRFTHWYSARVVTFCDSLVFSISLSIVAIALSSLCLKWTKYFCRFISLPSIFHYHTKYAASVRYMIIMIMHLSVANFSTEWFVFVSIFLYLFLGCQAKFPRHTEFKKQKRSKKCSSIEQNRK